MPVLHVCSNPSPNHISNSYTDARSNNLFTNSCANSFANSITNSYTDARSNNVRTTSASPYDIDSNSIPD